MNRKAFWSLLLVIVTLVGTVVSCGFPTPVPPTSPPVPTPTSEPLPPTQPLLIARAPARGEEAAPEAALTLTFDQPMDTDSVEAAFHVEPRVTGTISWPDAATMVFSPRTSWDRAARYRIKIDTSAKSAVGLPLREEVDFTFATVGYLEVTQVIPEPDTAEVEPSASVTVMFNRPVVPLQLVSASQASLPAPLTFDPPVEGSGEWINTSIYVFRPATGFVPGETYVATVAAGLTDTTGGVLEEDFTWNFTVQPPTIVWTQPASGDNKIPLTQPITVTFSQPMDRPSTAAAFSLRTSDDEPVSGRFSWHEGNTVLTFTPNNSLDLGMRYTARVGASARAASGNASLQDGAVWFFDTVPYPYVVSTTPGDGDLAADPYGTFEVHFSAPMDVSTLMPNITILPEPTGLYTYWNEYDNAFYISWDIEPSTAYEVLLGRALADPYGNVLGADQIVRFTTRALDPMVYLATPGQVGTYNGYTATQVYAVHQNVSQLDVSLYRIDLADFTRLTGPDRWSVWDAFDPASEAELVRAWSVPAQAELNAARYLRLSLAEDGGPLPPDLYFLEVTAPELGQYAVEPARHLLVVSRVHVTLKLAQREVLVWATDLATGDPLPGLSVTVPDPTSFFSSVALARGTTDRDGVFFTEIDDPIGDMWASYLAMTGAPGADDFGVALNLWYEGIAPWDFDIPSSFYTQPYRLYLYTDRPIYRPGQPVYYRGVVRNEDDAHYTLPGRLNLVLVNVYDDQGEIIFHDEHALSDMGTFDGELTLGQEATLGYYYIEVQMGPDHVDGIGFQVAEYRRPEFEVTVTPERDEVLAGDEVDVAVQATYFFGAPVANADVSWLLLAQDAAFRPDVPGWWDWSDTSRWDWWSQEEPGWGRVVADGEGTTDAQGRFVFSVPTDIADAILSQRLTIEATIVDESDRSVSNRATVLVHKGLFYVGLRPTRYVGVVDEEQTVDVRTVDWEGAPVGGVPLQVTFNRREWLNVQEEDAYGNLYWTWTPTDTVVYSETVTTDADGEAVAAFVPESGGTYIVRAEGTDDEGNAVVSATWLWVSGREYVSWRQENNDRINLVADRRTYEPGDVARILIPSPFQGEVTALVTVERGRIVEHWVQTLTGNAETIELPITDDFIPNVYVSVVLVKGVDETNPVPAYRVGYVSFDVSTDERALNITITPDRDLAGGAFYSPRDEVTAEIQVTDVDGNPVEAEVGLAVVDKAVLSLAADNAPAILTAFYGERGLGIRTSDSLSVLVDRITAQVSQEAKGGGGGGAEAMGAGFIRQDFPDTVFWSPSVRTDADGRATVSFHLSDQLTTWNLDARAVTEDTLVGQVELDLLSTKDLLVRPVTPRFFVVGDEVELAAVVHNNTDRALDVEVWLEADGVTLNGAARHQVSLAPGGQERVAWPVTVADGEWVDLTFYASGSGYSDAVKPPAGLPPDQLLPVYRYSAPEVVGTAGQLSDEGSVLEAVVVPRTVDTSQGDLTVRIEPSLAAGMVGGLDYLEHYPYECTEQVISRFLPNVLSYRALVELGVEDPELEDSLREQVSVGLQRLTARQHYDGGWGWWVGDESNPLVSAYVVFGLVKAQEAGFVVDQDVLARGIGYLEEHVRTTTRIRETWQANRQAFVLYTLAEARAAGVTEVEVSSYLASLYGSRQQLSHYGRAYLALAFGVLDADDSRLRTLLSDLNSAAIASATGAHWQESESDRWNWNTDTRTTALALDVLARFDPDNDLAPNAVRWLMHARTAERWETTQETAWALIALTDWMVATGELEGDYDWGVRLNGADLDEGSVTPATVDEVAEVQVAVADLLLGEANRLEIARGEGAGQLYYTAHLRAYLPVEEVRALNRGIVIGRSYEMAECEEDCEPITSARVGDLVRVRLTIVAPHDLQYVVIEDPFPAGAEPVDTSLLTTSVVGERPELRLVEEELPWWYWGWGWWWFSNTDLRDEKLVLFATSLPAGTYEYTYQLQIGLAGEYRVIPASAYEMYFPEVMGRSDGMIFGVER
ncbi:MAG: Ig-like domain-containing protein [Anaerolineae bacterium]|nr:Ig-like domain-containing protein [Anaerolineae bacterium]